MNNLSFIWLAKFKDNSEIPQFDLNDKENRFELIKNRFYDLQYFILKSVKNNTQFIVDLDKGIIYNSFNNIINYNSIEQKNNLRLVFFRRHTVRIGTIDLEEKEHEITYHLGYQYNDNNGHNHKTVLEISQDGSFVIRS